MPFSRWCCNAASASGFRSGPARCSRRWPCSDLNDLLNTALIFYFVFAVCHAVFPLVLQRRFGLGIPFWAGQVFPALALVLVLVPIFKLAEISFIVWPFIFRVDLLAIVLAVLLGSMLSVLIVLMLTLAATGALIFKIPATLTGMLYSLTKPLAKAWKPGPELNTMEIPLDGPRTIVTLNGVKVTDRSEERRVGQECRY